MDAATQYEAVILNSFEHNGEKKWNRHFIGNLRASKNGNGFHLYIPEGLAVSGQVLIQPKQAKEEQDNLATA